MAGSDSNGEVAQGEPPFSGIPRVGGTSAALLEDLAPECAWLAFRNKSGNAMGPQPSSEAEISSVAEEPGNPAVRLPRVSAWQRHPARSNRCADGGPAQSSGAR